MHKKAPPFGGGRCLENNRAQVAVAVLVNILVTAGIVYNATAVIADVINAVAGVVWATACVHQTASITKSVTVSIYVFGAAYR